MNHFEIEFVEYIQSRGLLNSVRSTLLAVSGGIDSMVMLHLFSKLHEQLKLELFVIHVNHQLRAEESLADEDFVKDISAVYGIPFYCERIDVMSYAHAHRLSKQLAARMLRYDCFERLRMKIDAGAVATAHHANDNAETVLLNIMRGTGIRGLAGIPAKRNQGCIIRPLLFATREEIEAYATEQHVKYRNDSSNRSLVYRRNEVRHNILPVLQKENPNLIQTLNQIATVMQGVNEKMSTMVNKAFQALIQKDPQGRLTVNLKWLKAEPDFLWDELFVELFHRMNIEPTEKKVRALHRLCTQPTGRFVELSSKLIACRDRDVLVFKVADNEQPPSTEVECGRSYDYNDCFISISTPERVPSRYLGTHEVEYIDAERLGKKLILRSWHTGDWFIPLGMKTKKKLSDFFTDQKVPRYQKSSIPVLESDGTIVWVCGKRLDDRFKLTDRTQTAIRLTCKPSQRAYYE